MRDCRATTVHPRAGGEHRRLDLRPQRRIGSSPRGRGTPEDQAIGDADRRFIPARAGNTRAASSRSFPSTVHPRAGGEHTLAATMGAASRGSSPRGRGTRRGRRGCARVRRFIPARAGNTAPAHCPPIPTSGSSPARAGNTSRRASGARRNPVHPRAGGEHPDGIRDLGDRAGSSPRGRGTPPIGAGSSLSGRFIPARAGNTPRGAPVVRGDPVHPRAGGEHRSMLPGILSGTGSSPRGRGTPRHPKLIDVDHRFIPARAGNTPRDRRTVSMSAVHPRAGGEH